MAKRGTLEHPKTKRLARELQMPVWAALGLLEAIWHWVSRYAPTGVLTAEDIADLCDTIRFDGNLAESLTKSGWLDVVADGWYIHDWHDHADDTTKKTLQKRGESFANGAPPRKEIVRESIANDSRINRDKPEPSQSLSQSHEPHGATLAEELLRGIDIPQYPQLTFPQVQEIASTFNLDKVDPSWLRAEVLKFQDWYTEKPSKANSPNTFTTLLKWLGRIERWPMSQTSTGVRLNVL